MANILVLFRHGAHDRGRARDGLDAALAALAFEHELDVLFVGDGVSLLRDAAQSAPLQRDWTPGLRALPRHGARRLGADRDALAAHGLERGPLALPVEVLDPATRARWMAQADVVLPF
jgi:tRNA 2-thiouridine synthesizing protein C